ncbi:THUMP-like domain-containing protein [Arsenicicoccus sp. oral taxon 190]|uniref:THUMP-like domain-containing protein n=1 Tax=Arsenicicoccus sp. oral taxon 190 TaxID=1658671 RepID=UPI00067A35C3|nr:class I SAM-dependent methyltransferase [Arsenicicoccus sp. oral taxon 190]AKT50150.1 hypothetical protein ADJ73_00270 [Arsenicicoccus sp. oral taxon 190]
MDLATARWLTSPEALAILAGLGPYADSAALATSQRLRRTGLDADQVAAVLTQSMLRTRGRTKLGDAVDELLLTVDGLEQATRPAIAAHHAARLRDAGAERVLDLGCGLALDGRAMAAAGSVVDAIDADEVTATLATHNLGREVRCARAEEVAGELAGGDRHTAVWLDPARRTPGVADATGRTRRTFRLDDLAPSWELVQDVAGRVPAAGAKLSPAFAHAARPEGTEAQWVSWRGEVLECTLWWGAAARHDGRTALVMGGEIASPTAAVVTEDDVPADRPGVPQGLAEWIYEPDRAVLRAGLVGALEARTGGVELDDGVGYVTAGVERDLPWARRFRVVEQIPLQDKAIRAYLRGIDCATVTLKKRGVDVDPDRLRRTLRLKGSRPATLILTRMAGRPTAIHVTPA